MEGNPRVYKALKLELAAVLEELKRIENGNTVNDDLIEVIMQINKTLYGDSRSEPKGRCNMSVKNIKIRLNLEKEDDRRVYDYLLHAEKSHSKAVIFAVCGFLDLSEEKAKEDIFLQRVVDTIREEAVKLNPFTGLLQYLSQPTAQTYLETENAQEEAEENMLDFLDTF